MIIDYIRECCDLELFENHAILRIFEQQKLSAENGKALQNKFKEHFGNREFILIKDRKFHYELNFEFYKKTLPKNLIGIAIVSKNQNERERAIEEQQHFDQSFAFFEELEDAIAWSNSFFK